MVIGAVNLGKMRDVNIRSIWSNENMFSDWLKENAAQIAEEVGIELAELSRESDVGKFSADLFGREETTGDAVVVENQFGETDHDHLGKLLTYVSGKNAKIGIWIAEKFTEEHMATLEYLNENIKEDGVAFFGIEIKVKQIGDSEPAPMFDVVVKPNEWKRWISQATLTESEKRRHAIRLEFFTELVNEYSRLNPNWRKVKPRGDSWLGFGAGISGCCFTWCFRSKNGSSRFAVELHINRGDMEENEAIFNKLLSRRAEIEKELGSKLDFSPPSEGKRMYTIGLSTPTSGVSTKLSSEEKKKLIKWGTENMKRFVEVMVKYVNER